MDVVKDVLKFLGTKEAAIIHGENGAAIPAFNGTGDSWANNYEGKNVQAYVDQLEYSVQFHIQNPNLHGSRKLKQLCWRHTAER